MNETEGGRAIKWTEAIRSPPTQEWSLGGFATLKRVNAARMSDDYNCESREFAATSEIVSRVNKSL